MNPGSEIGRLRRLQEVIARATAAPSHREVARVIVEEGVTALGGWLGALWLVDDESTLELLHWVGVEPGRRFRRVPLAGDSPLALAVRTRTPVWIASRAEYVAAFPQSAGREHEDEDEIACACLPLVASSGAIGGLMFAFHTEHSFPEDERTFLVTIASQCANAMERLRLLDSLNQLLTAEAEARRQAEAANRAKDEFLALLGHELRNPLAPIVTALSLMKLKRGDHERERSIIERQTHHLVRLVDDLLDISRITRGRVALVRGPVALAEVIGQALEAAQPLILERGHHLAVELRGGIIVDADHHRLTQVIGNLVVNAAKYTPDGGHLALSTQVEGDFARISVRDDGVGITPELLEHVFEMFVQGDRSSDRAEGGLGLGLAVVKNLVERHGGRVAAASEGAGRGSTFTVWWPLAGEDARVVPPPPVVSTQPVKPLKVLVVDDNVDAATTLGELLRVLGHLPVVVHDAPSALAIARDEAPELALVDLGLPILDGFELIRRLRDLPGLGSLTAIAVTGYGQPADRARSHAAGFKRHVVKPVGLEDLRSLLASL
ncbi:MAG: GAF domain-containing protein [Kofleriaceae bacterium]|nr:GAF domain-containing protein [Kofleriaceae bacterium]